MVFQVSQACFSVIVGAAYGYISVAENADIVEGIAAEKAIDKLNDADIENMKKLNKKHLEAIIRKDYKAVLRNNEKFHFIIYNTSSALLVSIIETLWLQSGPTCNFLYPKYEIGRKGNKNHQIMIDAIIKHDVGALKKAIVKDINDAKKLLLTIF